MKKIKAGVIVFPGTNCEKDTFDALVECGFEPKFVMADEKNIKNFDMVILPGGFSYGDYIHSGRIAKFSPVIESIKQFKGLKVGICNGFQILTEINLLKGALLLNKTSHFISKKQSLIFKIDFSPLGPVPLINLYIRVSMLSFLLCARNTASALNFSLHFSKNAYLNSLAIVSVFLSLLSVFSE